MRPDDRVSLTAAKNADANDNAPSADEPKRRKDAHREKRTGIDRHIDRFNERERERALRV